MTFNIVDLYHKAVANNINFWRQRTVERMHSADDLFDQRQVMWQAVEAGLTYLPTQHDSTELMIGLLPLIERWGVWLEWLPLVELAMTLTQTPNLHISLLLVYGRIHILNQNFNDAIEQLNMALAMSKTHQNDVLTARAYYSLVNAYLGTKDYSQAQIHGMKALDLIDLMPSSTQAALYNSLGLIEMGIGEYAASEVQFQRAMTIWTTLNEPTQFARTCLNLGVIYQWQKRWEEAKSCYEQANKALSITASTVDKLKVINELGNILYSTNDLSAAEATFRQGVEAAQNLQGMYHLRGSLTHNLGNTLLALERLVESRIYLEKSIILWRQANDELELANSLGTLAELFEQQENFISAASNYQKALELLTNFPHHPWAQKLVVRFQEAQARCAH